MTKNIWEIAIGLNKVDNLKPSSFLRELIDKKLSCDEMEKEILKYYGFRYLTSKIERDLRECDLVSIRTVKLLENKEFKFSIDYLKKIHKSLFSDILKKNYVGIFRNYNISKNERILSGNSVIYADYRELTECLNYDFEREKKNDYKNLPLDEKINKVSNFISSIWQVHPFIEGNTRTTAIFLIKYLKKLGFKLNEDIFMENSLYFRNALVLSNYSNRELKISNDFRFLTSFFIKLIVDKNEKLMLIKEKLEQGEAEI
ncbi:Fic family protein [uncultured Fusobacterium sp.]|uniref:Fic family protein n=1 Tax=uncultured Fusobacterium sp. TaxID=159267 RepID=UPI00078C61EE|nr:Fic family protein [uncultured Fusobacterium sp.]AMP53000.1 Fic/DOC family [uncultured bacterium]